MPCLFNTPAGIKALINIFKQDSTFQSTKTEINLGYLLNINKRIYLGYRSTESGDIQNSINPDLSDYENSFITVNFEYSKRNNTNILFLTKSYLSFKAGTGKRTIKETITNTATIQQKFISISFMNNFFINAKNYINIKNENYFLQSKSYLTVELYRFGGMKSIRGFSENSLQASTIISTITEYRYLISPNLYLNSMLDMVTIKNLLELKKKIKLTNF